MTFRLTSLALGKSGVAVVERHPCCSGWRLRSLTPSLTFRLASLAPAQPHAVRRSLGVWSALLMMRMSWVRRLATRLDQQSTT